MAITEWLLRRVRLERRKLEKTIRRNLAGSLVGSIQETQDMLDFCSRHNITADVEIIPIQQVNKAFERVLKGDVRYRFVIDMASLETT